jgi:hypothetical protein
VDEYRHDRHRDNSQRNPNHQGHLDAGMHVHLWASPCHAIDVYLESLANSIDWVTGMSLRLLLLWLMSGMFGRPA